MDAGTFLSWFKEEGLSVPRLGPADTLRQRNVNWQMRDKQMFSGGEDGVWKQTWGVFERVFQSSQRLSLCCELKALKINVGRKPQRWTFHEIHSFLSALKQVVGCSKEKKDRTFGTYYNGFFFNPSFLLQKHVFISQPLAARISVCVNEDTFPWSQSLQQNTEHMEENIYTSATCIAFCFQHCVMINYLMMFMEWC